MGGGRGERQVGWQILMSIFFCLAGQRFVDFAPKWRLSVRFLWQPLLMPILTPLLPRCMYNSNTLILSTSGQVIINTTLDASRRPSGAVCSLQSSLYFPFLKFSFPLQIVDWFDLLAASVKTQYNLPSYDIVWDVSLSESDLILEAVQSGLADAACGR